MCKAYDEFKIISVKEHYEVYYNGKFFCSADTPLEAVKEIENFKALFKRAI